MWDFGLMGFTAVWRCLVIEHRLDHRAFGVLRSARVGWVSGLEGLGVRGVGA